jgi:hypothetical protein
MNNNSAAYGWTAFRTKRINDRAGSQLLKGGQLLKWRLIIQDSVPTHSIEVQPSPIYF